MGESYPPQGQPTGGGSGTPSNTVTGPDSFGAPSNAGSATTYSRGDHDHGLPADSFPIGGICWWSNLNGAVPSNYAICDGTANSPGPDLRDRFIVGAGLTHIVDSSGGPVATGSNATGITVAKPDQTSGSSTTGITVAKPDQTSGSSSTGITASKPDQTSGAGSAHLHTVGGVKDGGGGTAVYVLGAASNNTSNESAHTHDVGSVSITVTDPKHTHDVATVSDTVTDGGHTHDVPTVADTVTDPGHTHSPGLPKYWALYAIQRMS